jgi:hypothetical protein
MAPSLRRSEEGSGGQQRWTVLVPAYNWNAEQARKIDAGADAELAAAVLPSVAEAVFR